VTQTEAATILAYLASAWPRTSLPDETVKVWARHMESLDFETAMRAAEALVDSSSWFPSVAEFKNTYSSILARQQMERPAITDGVEVMGPDEYPRFIGMCREALRNSRDYLSDVPPTNEQT
jgi:hypothetical protein